MSILSNRLLRKLASGWQFVGDSERRTAVYKTAHEDSSTELTHKLSAEVEFPKKPNKNLGVIYAILSGLCYGFLGYFGVTILNGGLSVLNMLFWRFAIATLLLSIILLSQYRHVFKSNKENLKVIIYGAAFFAGSAILYFYSSTFIGTGLAMVIFFTYPAIVMLFNIFYYKIKMSKTYFLAFIMLLIGLLALTDLHNSSFNIFGIGLAIINAFIYACYIVASKNITTSPTISTLMVSTGAMITCFIAALIDKSFLVPQELNIWLSIIGISVVCTVLAILLLLKSMQYISTGQASMLSVLEPVFVLIFGITLLGEKVTYLQLIGAIIILAAALVTLIPQSESK